MLKLEVSYRFLIFAVLTLAVFWLVIQIWPVLLWLLVAIIFTVGLLPAVESLVRARVPRSLAVIGILLAILAATIGLFSFLVPALIREIKDVRENLPDSAHEVEKLLASLGIHVELQEKARNIDWDEIISGRAAVDYGQRLVTTVFTIVTITAMTA